MEDRDNLFARMVELGHLYCGNTQFEFSCWGASGLGYWSKWGRRRSGGGAGSASAVIELPSVAVIAEPGFDKEGQGAHRNGCRWELEDIWYGRLV